jgi:betaine-aldehyde dehydrogenase
MQVKRKDIHIQGDRTIANQTAGGRRRGGTLVEGDGGWQAFAQNASQVANGPTGGVSAKGVLLGKALDPLGVPTKLFIGGEWVAPEGNRTTKVYDPATERLLYRCPSASKADVAKAVSAARTAFDSGIWSGLTGEQRAQYLDAIADQLRAKQKEIAELEVKNNGKPLADAMMDVSDSADCFSYYARLAKNLDREQNAPLPLMNEALDCKIRREPLGVAAAIIPWNYPLLMAAWKVAPALAAGCTMVLKPSEVTPITAMKLAEICDEIGLPPGVLNVVPGTGKDAGKALATSKGIDKLAFTGGTETGKRIMRAASENLIPVTLELGGKSPAVVFQDADIDRIVDWVAFGVFGNQGEVCSATSRLIVHESVAEELIARLVELANGMKIGPGLEEGVKIGPLVSKQHYEKVLSLIETGKREGATLLAGGGKTEHETGWFVEPTIFSNVTPDMTIWNREIFGPVLAITTFKDEAEAIRLANDSDYGLAAAVFSRDKERLDRVSERLQAGVVWQNCSQPVGADGPPWGGVKKSGIGRELGRWGLENYLSTKAVAEYVANEPFRW